MCCMKAEEAVLLYAHKLYACKHLAKAPGYLFLPPWIQTISIIRIAEGQ